MKTVLATFPNTDQARDAIQDLMDAGFDRSHIGFAVNDASGEYSRYTEPDYVYEEDPDAGDGAGFGAIVGTLVGAAAGLVAITVPGVGPIIAAGPLSALGGAAAGAGVGAATGAVTGGLTAALVDLGVEEQYAGYYAEEVRRGGALVTVTANETNVSKASDILHRHNPIDVDQRMQQWRQQGWTEFDPMSDPFTAEELARERETYTTESTTAETDRVRVYDRT